MRRLVVSIKQGADSSDSEQAHHHNQQQHLQHQRRQHQRQQRLSDSRNATDSGDWRNGSGDARDWSNMDSVDERWMGASGENKMTRTVTIAVSPSSTSSGHANTPPREKDNMAYAINEREVSSEAVLNISGLEMDTPQPRSPASLPTSSPLSRESGSALHRHSYNSGHHGPPHRTHLTCSHSDEHDPTWPIGGNLSTARFPLQQEVSGVSGKSGHPSVLRDGEGHTPSDQHVALAASDHMHYKRSSRATTTTFASNVADMNSGIASSEDMVPLSLYLQQQDTIQSMQDQIRELQHALTTLRNSVTSHTQTRDVSVSTVEYDDNVVGPVVSSGAMLTKSITENSHRHNAEYEEGCGNASVEASDQVMASSQGQRVTPTPPKSDEARIDTAGAHEDSNSADMYYYIDSDVERDYSEGGDGDEEEASFVLPSTYHSLEMEPPSMFNLEQFLSASQAKVKCKGRLLIDGSFRYSC